MIRKITLHQGILLIAITLALLMRLFLGLTRYFDPDEFAHFHWAFHFVLGLKPYKDFFIYHIPFYQFFLLPVFLLPQGPGAVIAARIIMFLIYVASLICLYLITNKITKNSVTSLLAVFIASIFPIMTDKSIEVRPDMLMVLLYVIPVVLAFLIPHWKPKHAIIAGLSMGASIMVFEKILFAAPALGIILIWEPLTHAIATRKIPHWKTWIPLFWFTGAMLIPALLFVVYLLINGILAEAFHNVVTVTKELYSIESIKFSPILALTPWPLIYLDRGGPSLPWGLNTVLLFTFLPGLIILALKKYWKALWFFIIYFIVSLIYLTYFPTPFVQYFVPIALVGSTLSAVFFMTLFRRIKNTIVVSILLCILSAVGLVSYWQQYHIRTTPDNTNAEQMQVITDLVTHTKPQETVYDMVGSYAFRPPGYVLCCHRYAVFYWSLNPRPITLIESLQKNQTKFLVLDRNGYVFWQVPEPDMTFLRTNYIPSAYYKIYSVGYKFGCTSGTCTRLNLDDQPMAAFPDNIIPVFISETYKVTTVPAGGVATLNSKQVRDGETITLPAGPATVYVSENVTKITIQLDR